jgi:hypothetical protein
MPLTGAERQRIFRERQKLGTVCMRVAVAPDVVDALIDSGAISEADAGDESKLGATVEALLAAWAQEGRRQNFRNVVTPKTPSPAVQRIHTFAERVCK